MDSPWITGKKSTEQYSSVLDVESINLDKNKRSKMAEFVKSLGGKRPIQRILIANNGMAATKAITSMRQWAYMTFGKQHDLEDEDEDDFENHIISQVLKMQIINA